MSGYNFIGQKSSTKRIHAPGGSSSLSSVLGFGAGPANNQQQQRTNGNQQHMNSNQRSMYGNQQRINGSQQRMHGNQHRNSYGNDRAPVHPQSSSAFTNNNRNTGIIGQQNHVQMNVNTQQQMCSTVNDMKYSRDGIAMSDAEKVREFTYEAGQPVPGKPQAMNTQETLELLATVMNPSQAKNTLSQIVRDASEVPRVPITSSEDHVIAEQADALVDIWYYSLNSMAKKGVNLSSVFNVVHDANLAKRDPQTGKFEKRADGKIIKPRGWKAPNIDAEIYKQMNDGSWN